MPELFGYGKKKVVRVRKGKGIAFTSGMVNVGQHGVMIRSPQGKVQIKHAAKHVFVEKALIKKGSMGIPKRFAAVNYGKTLMISSGFSGLKKLKKKEYGVVM